MKNSAIEWCDHTFNPWEGCTKVSPGCAHCYAETRNARFGGGTAPNWGKGAPRRRTSVQNWNQVLRWNREEETKMVGRAEFVEGRRPRVFCASLADWLDTEVPIEWFVDLLNLIRETPSLDWLLLTKRPQNWKTRLNEARACMQSRPKPITCTAAVMVEYWLGGYPPPNVWVGTTVEDQQRADERIPQILEIPARVRFLSCEPLLGPVDLGLMGTVPMAIAPHSYAMTYQMIHWVICGGESGTGARPMHPAWARSMRDQCAGAGVPFLFKQWGEHAHIAEYWLMGDNACRDVKKEFPGGIRLRTDGALGNQHILEGEVFMARVGKKLAGRQLDGVEHNGFPA